MPKTTAKLTSKSTVIRRQPSKEVAKKFADDLVRQFFGLGPNADLTNLRRKSGLWSKASDLFQKHANEQ